MTDKNTQLIQTKSYLSNVFNILRADVNASEYHFVLFLLTLQKEGILDGLFNREEHSLLQAIPYKIIDSKSKNAKIHEKIWELFQPVLAKLNRITLIEILYLLRELDYNILQENFPEIFDDLLYKLTKSQGRFGGEFILPLEISQFLSNLVELPKGAKIYNPFAGLASFGVFTDESYQYLGQELNYATWALGQLRLIAYNRELNSEFLQGDSIEDWNPKKIYSHTKPEDFFKFPPENEKYDLIIANPPFNLRPLYPIQSRFGRFKNCEHFLIEKGLEDLTSNGKIIAVVSHGLLFRGASEQGLRHFLVENDILEMVIAFPDGLLFNTSIPIAILVINKDKKDRGFVKFIDAKPTVETTSFREKRINVAALDKITKDNIESEYVRIISNDAIATFDYNLNVPRYLQREITGVQFREFVTPIRTQKNYQDTYGKFVRIRDLKEDKLEYFLDLAEIEKVELPRNLQKISESCLLLARRWKTLKPTFFEFVGKPIFITPDILAFKIDESKANISYLVNELHADYAIEQLDSYRIGSIIPTITRDDLLSIRINLPSIEEQRGKVAGLIELTETIKALKLQNNALDYRLKSKNYDDYATLKHTLGTPRQNILSYADVLVSFFENNQSKAFFEVNSNFIQDLGLDLLSVFKAIKSDIDFMSELLKKGEKGLVLTDYVIEAVPLTEVQNIISQNKKVGHKFNISLFPIEDENKKQLGIGINKSLLRVLLDNLISNAEKHGFDSKKSDNQMLIDLKIIDNIFVIDIKNNGKPFPKNFDKDKFTQKYTTANPQNGTGLGGYIIDIIVTYFGAKWDLVLNEEIFPVRFVFQFPIISL